MKKSKKFIRLISTLVIFCVLIPYLPVIAADSIPSDISGKWYEQTVINSIAKGWTNGYPDGTFKGDNTITNAEFITLVNSVFSLSSETDIVNPFEDVKESDWFYNDVLTAYSNNLIPIIHFHQFNDKGQCMICKNYRSPHENPELFKPNENITRQDAILILSRLDEIEAIYVEPKLVPPDFTNISKYAYSSVIKMYTLRIAKGDTELKLHPLNNITRAEALTLVERTYNYINGLLPEFVEPNFIIATDKFNSQNIYVTNTSDLYQYSFKSVFESPKELNNFSYTSPITLMSYELNLNSSPQSNTIAVLSSKAEIVCVIDTWEFYYKYVGYVPKTGEKITMKITVTNDKNTITKDYFIDYIVE